MLNQDFIRKLSHRAAEMFPGAEHLREDFQRRLESLLQDSFDRLNIVTRDEFEAQLAVLERTRATVAELEQQVASLEQALADAGADKSQDS